MYQYTNISFPSLGIDIDPVREFSLGPLSILVAAIAGEEDHRRGTRHTHDGQGHADDGVGTPTGTHGHAPPRRAAQPLAPLSAR
jgi:hypothetical protein